MPADGSVRNVAEAKALLEFDEFSCLLLKLDFYLAPAGFCPLVRAGKLNEFL